MLELRKQTRAIASYFEGELKSHLATISPLFNPRLVFGRHVKGSGQVASRQADAAFAALEALYAAANRVDPLNLRDEFERPMEATGWSPAVYPLQYEYRAEDGGVEKGVMVTTPFRWALTYSEWSPDRLRQLIAAQAKASDHELEKCVLQYLMLHVTLEQRPGINRLLTALRLPVVFEKHSEFGEIPIAVIHAPISTFRPPDDIVIQSTEVSGVTSFEEIVTTDDIAALEDPLRAKLESLVT